MSLKNFTTKSKKSREQGYVSFTEDDLAKAKSMSQENAEAYSLLDAAMCTSSHLSAKDKEGNNINVDDIYPCTEAECDEMDNLLDKAEKVVSNKSDSFFQERLSELRDIVRWSRQKHWTFKWSLIGGCVLAILGMMYMSSSASADAKRSDREVAVIENWVPQDTTIAYENCSTGGMMYQESRANDLKHIKLRDIKKRIQDLEFSAQSGANYLDTCTTESSRKALESRIAGYKESAKSCREEYDKINKMKFKEFQEFVLKDKKQNAERSSAESSKMYFWLIYVIILIPAYIYYSHEYGYNITRHRAEAKALGCIQKVFFSIATFFLGSGLAMALLPDVEVTTHYSDGSSDTHTEGNSGNFIILALKAVMIFIGLLIFAVTSVFIMTYVTVMAIKRNYDWSKVAAATQQAVGKTCEAIKESGIADKASEMAKSAMDKATDLAKEAKEKINEKKNE